MHTAMGNWVFRRTPSNPISGSRNGRNPCERNRNGEPLSVASAPSPNVNDSTLIDFVSYGGGVNMVDYGSVPNFAI